MCWRAKRTWKPWSVIFGCCCFTCALARMAVTLGSSKVITMHGNSLRLRSANGKTLWGTNCHSLNHKTACRRPGPRGFKVGFSPVRISVPNLGSIWKAHDGSEWPDRCCLGGQPVAGRAGAISLEKLQKRVRIPDDLEGDLSWQRAFHSRALMRNVEQDGNPRVFLADKSSSMRVIPFDRVGLRLDSKGMHSKRGIDGVKILLEEDRVWLRSAVALPLDGFWNGAPLILDTMDSVDFLCKWFQNHCCGVWSLALFLSDCSTFTLKGGKKTLEKTKKHLKNIYSNEEWVSFKSLGIWSSVVWLGFNVFLLGCRVLDWFSQCCKSRGKQKPHLMWFWNRPSPVVLWQEVLDWLQGSEMFYAWLEYFWQTETLTKDDFRTPLPH